ncbi:molybdopterin-dependent oxidoreductase [Cryobacterium sp. PH29-G1]|uniref:molybdopterin-dependent oxidoreductase n=1 Tax=Cryobacterium sp. PH29-G1 TaxID=3046211 RepID=UPI0024BB860D|nr:molybdopterin-dependent oxidoreductase [Cryobacterium sp. PH29-G1]MDJ0349792.1 molybdopterin-dependent oxidoreductase [Cryobacterium sp. PH29-G1]
MASPDTLSPPTRPSPLPVLGFWRPAAAGVAAALAGLGLAELTAAWIAPGASPVLSVGALVIDIVPAGVKELVIGLFGTADKIVLIVTIILVLIVIAALAGVLESRRPPYGRVLVVLIGAIALFAALSRSSASTFDAVPAVVAMGVSAIALTFLTTRLPLGVSAAVESDGPDRRRFLVYTGATAGVGLLALIGGQLKAAATRAADTARALFTLPAASVPAAAIPAGASFDVAGITPLITPNADFYRIDTALSVPRIDPNTWRLKITGMVENEVELNFAELLALPLEESTTTLACVSNYVGGDLIGNATWLGYPIRELLARAKPTSGADMVLSTSQDGFTASTPIEALTDERNAILAVGMNGEPLPLEHGYPVRMVVPGLYGYVSATKWVVELKLTRFDQEQGYWTPRGWSERGPVKLSSRIDVPRAGSSVPAGPVVIAGVAWSQHVGVSAVAVQIDDGPWQDATLADAISVDTWRQWAFTWTDATAGQHSVRVRATDSDGLVQTSVSADVAPDGATGLHEVSVTVS